MAGCTILLIALISLASPHALASDPSPLQDFCVADLTSGVFVNGFVCKDPKTVSADDFFFSGLDKPGDTNNRQGSDANLLTAANITGLNTLGVALARIDFAPYGLNAPHSHPRASEILTVLEGSLYAAFVTSGPRYKLYTKVLRKGDIFVFPQGLVHFQFNLDSTNAVAIAAFGGQNPGRINVADAVFGPEPPIPDYVLQKAFRVDGKTVDMLRDQFRGMVQVELIQAPPFYFDLLKSNVIVDLP